MVCGLFDLNTVNNEEETATACDSPSSSAASGNFESVVSSSSSSIAVCMELWHACAGPLISLPKKGSSVVYFPQGHLDHLPENPAGAYDLPPHVFCRVIDVKLHADAASDEVYAQVSLIPDQQLERRWREGVLGEVEDEDPVGSGKSLTPHMFCKSLTASDTSTHGGFSVPRRAAEDCFPPLDYRQQRPSQELVAKDLHGTEWKFRHIYRGQPRRHLLTTGWSAFVNKKKLVSGDAVLFLRGGDGELRLGIRRAVQDKSGATTVPPNSQQFGASNIAAVMNAISMENAFNICYNPRARSSDIITTYQKFSKSLSHSLSCGMRFKIRSETDDSSERSGLIVGISDVDPARWPGSKWKCLLVRWDGMEINRVNRVSPWEIELAGSLSVPNNLMLPGTKRSRVGFTSTKSDLPVPLDGTEVSDFGEPLRFQKVLQGQEVFGFSNPYTGMEASDPYMRCDPDLHGSRNSMMRHIQADCRFPLQRSVLGESFQFHKVLQGQETMPIMSYARGSETNHFRGKNVAADMIDGIQLPNHGTSWSTRTPQVYNTGTPHPVSGSSPSSVLLMQRPLHYGNQDSIHVPQRIPATTEREGLRKFRSTRRIEEDSKMAFSHCPIPSQPQDSNNQKFVSMYKNSCRLFGFCLTDGQGESPNESASAYDRESNSSPCNEDELYHQPPLTTTSTFTKGNDMHTVRDRLLDIAL